jgi:hypothetical protein
LDIDSNSKYHNKQSLDKLIQVLADAGLSKSSLFRSSYSGGWHLYIFFEELVSSAELHRELHKLLTLRDFDVSKGTLEIFPHPGKNSLGLGLRLPLQSGWAWLDKATLEVEYDRAQLSATKSLELFLDALDGDCNPFFCFKQLKTYVQHLQERREAAALCGRGPTRDNIVPIRRAENQLQPSEYLDFAEAIFRTLPPGIIIDNWYKGRLFHLNGLTAPGQRAEAITCVGHYLFYGDPSRHIPPMGYGYEQERAWAIHEFLAARHHGQSEELNRGTKDALAQIDRAANWRPAHKTDAEPAKYSTARPISWIRENANRQANSRKRITAALETLKQKQQPFTTVELQEAAGCSRTTLYKHQDIWRKDYEDLADGFFAFCTHEYNAVEGAGSQKTKPPATADENVTPPGLLAARRIAYEISRRSQKEKVEIQKASVGSLEAREKEWQGNVTRLVKKAPSELSIKELKSLLTVLVGYLCIAPSEDHEVYLREKLSPLREELSRRIEDTKLRPAPS